ncbi:DUF3515 domain-containing protein [Streptomyces palmae]|uniref:DUF3515 domain-containing protein n=1 Tax=Streptomyces palmae TaxID=1701085 RepID=A0A4Z0HAW5_9ACTN|nr:DUF3515 domain-containing protein [Streptomyces palmae]
MSVTAPLLALVAVAGCSSADGSGGPPSLAAPTPRGEAAGFCRALHRELPRRVDGLARRQTDPVSDSTAAWGDPTVELRCGVPEPRILTPGSEDYTAAPDSAEINGVQWLIEEQGDHYRFTTVLRRTNVEVTVDRSSVPATDALVDLAGAIKKTVPFGI